MKKQYIYTLVAAFIGLSLSAQIDRSKIPASGPSPEINLKDAKEFKADNGLTVLVATDKKFPVVNWSLNLNNPPAFDGDKAGLTSLAGALLGKETQQSTKEEFAEKVDFLGASVSVSPNGGFGYCLSKYKDEVFALFAEAALEPKFTEKELDFEKDQLIQGIKSGENSAAAIAGNVRNALFFGKDHANGEIATEESVNKVTLDDIKQYYAERFKPSNGYLIFSGDITVKEAKALLSKYMGSWAEGTTAKPEYPEFSDVATTQIDFVDVPNAVQTELAVMSVSKLKMTDEDYFAALVANYILGGAFGSYLNMNLREEHGYTYGARSSLSAGRWYDAAFMASTKVRNEVTDSAVVETLKEIKRIRTEPVDAEKLENAKAKFLGNFILQSEDKTVAARRALTIKTNNLPEDFYKNYIANINKVSVEDVQRVAQKYFTDEKARIVLVGKAADVLENVEKIEWNGQALPVNFYDKEANPTDRPVLSKPIPADVTAETILKSYVMAIGGEDKVRAINSTLMNADVTISGAPFKPKATIKQMTPNKYSMEMTIEGMGTVMKRSFDGKSGYNEQQGRRVPMDEKAVSSRQSEKGLFPEMFYDAANVELVSLTAIDGKDVYKIKVTKGDQESFRYYDAETKLLVRTEESQEAQGQTVTSITDYSNYQNVDGVMMPYQWKVTSGPQIITMDMTEVMVNQGVTEEDFK